MTDLELCNLALSRLGQAALSGDFDATAALTDLRKAHCLRQLTPAKRQFLSTMDWQFARDDSDTLTDSGDTPTIGFKYAFVLPSDFVRLHAVFSAAATDAAYGEWSQLTKGYALSQGKLRTTSEFVQLNYVSDGTPLTAWPPPPSMPWPL